MKGRLSALIGMGNYSQQQFQRTQVHAGSEYVQALQCEWRGIDSSSQITIRNVVEWGIHLVLCHIKMYTPSTRSCLLSCFCSGCIQNRVKANISLYNDNMTSNDQLKVGKCMHWMARLSINSENKFTAIIRQ